MEINSVQHINFNKLNEISLNKDNYFYVLIDFMVQLQK